MGWGTGNIGGGSGGGLNFKVVGNPQPSNPKENTIWLNTDVDITGWVFSATEPENLEEGMVWIYTGTSSSVEFNALKKNGITVYPLSAKQYVSGAWADKTAKSYQGGKWVDWFYYLMKDGTFDTTTTNLSLQASSSNEFVGDGYIEFSVSRSGGDIVGHYGRRTNGKISLKGVKTIYAKVNVTKRSASGSQAAGAEILVMTGTDKSSIVARTEIDALGESVLSLDVSNLTDSYYIAVGAMAYAPSGTPSATVRVYDVYW